MTKTLTIKIKIPQNAYKLLNEYGYDFEQNATEAIRRDYFALVGAIKENEKTRR